MGGLRAGIVLAVGFVGSAAVAYGAIELLRAFTDDAATHATVGIFVLIGVYAAFIWAADLEEPGPPPL